MIYLGELVHIGDDVEEEVVLRIGNAEITCFASICPYQIYEGVTYRVAITPVIFNGYSVAEVSRDIIPSLVHVGSSFAYEAVGDLNGNQINTGVIMLEDDVLLREYSYLHGKRIAWKIDRLDVEFLP